MKKTKSGIIYQHKLRKNTSVVDVETKTYHEFASRAPCKRPDNKNDSIGLCLRIRTHAEKFLIGTYVCKVRSFFYF